MLPFLHKTQKYALTLGGLNKTYRRYGSSGAVFMANFRSVELKKYQLPETSKHYWVMVYYRKLQRAASAACNIPNNAVSRSNFQLELPTLLNPYFPLSALNVDFSRFRTDVFNWTVYCFTFLESRKNRKETIRELYNDRCTASTSRNNLIINRHYRSAFVGKS